MTDKLVIAIDGPSGVGKSTLGKALARRLHLLFIDSGAIYRAVALQTLRRHIPIDDTAAVAQVAGEARIRLEGDPDHPRILLEGDDVSEEIRTPEVSRAASVVATIPAVRDAVVEKLRAMSREGGIVMDGRDIGTRVFPDARIKLFLEAAPDVRATRRWLEEQERARQVSLDQVQAELEERDRRDRERAATPLVPAADAILIDTSQLDLDGVIARVLNLIKKPSESGESGEPA